jgi:hypothetical protein
MWRLLFLILLAMLFARDTYNVMFEQEGTFHYVHNSRNRKGHAASDEH